MARYPRPIIRSKPGSVLPVGLVIGFSGREIPDGWLACNGNSVEDLKWTSPILYEVLVSKGVGRLPEKDCFVRAYSPLQLHPLI